MPRRSPPPLDAARVRALLAPVVPRRDEEGRGWLPEGAPPDADLSWTDEPREEEGVDEGAGGAEPSAGRHRPGPRVLTVPVAIRGARLSVSWRAVAALAVLLALAVLVFAVRVARAELAAAPEAVGPTGGLVARTSVPSAFASTVDARGSPTTARVLVVDVVGQVARPGVVSVPAGSRVADVLVAVGGPLPGADVQRLNLARLVADGEQVFVPRPGETPPSLVGAAGGVSSGPGGAATGPGSTGAAEAVDLNAATLTELDTLPGVGPVLAQRILDWRTTHGRFTSVDELGEVSGIGDKLLAQIRPKVRVT